MGSSNEYMKQYMANRRKARRLKLINMLGGQCEKCGSDSHLEFNHKDRTQREFVLSGKDLDRSWNKILEELKKCELLCDICHLHYTKMQYKTRQIRPWNDKTHISYVCGTMRSYQESKCRCNLCGEAKRLYRKKLIKYDEIIPL